MASDSYAASPDPASAAEFEATCSVAPAESREGDNTAEKGATENGAPDPANTGPMARESGGPVAAIAAGALALAALGGVGAVMSRFTDEVRSSRASG